MTKLEDTEIKTKDRNLKEHIAEIVALWNAGKLGFKEISAAPIDTPVDVELRVFNSGAGAVRLYVFVPGSGQSGIGWWTSANFTEVV